MKWNEPEVPRFVFVSEVQTPQARFVLACTTIGILVVPTIENPNRSGVKPKEASCCTAGFQQTAGRPATVSLHPVVLGR